MMQKLSPKADSVLAYLDWLQRHEGKETSQGETIWIPPRPRGSWYLEYCNQTGLPGEQNASEKYFFHLWNAWFSFMKPRCDEYKGSIGHCSTCADAFTCLGQAKGQRKRVLKTLIEDHRQKWEGSRREIEQLKQKTIEFSKMNDAANGPHGARGLLGPGEKAKILMSLDAMENAKIRLPHFGAQQGKDLKQMTRPMIRVTGVIVPGILHAMFVSPPGVPKGGSQTCEVIMRTLDVLEKQSLSEAWAFGGRGCGASDRATMRSGTGSSAAGRVGGGRLQWLPLFCRNGSIFKRDTVGQSKG